MAKQQEELEAAKKRAAQVQPKPVPLKSTFHCDCCTKVVVGEVVDFEGENYRLECYACHSCKTNLKYRAAFREEKGLACEKCRKAVKCNILESVLIGYFQSFVAQTHSISVSKYGEPSIIRHWFVPPKKDIGLSSVGLSRVCIIRSQIDFEFKMFFYNGNFLILSWKISIFFACNGDLTTFK